MMQTNLNASGVVAVDGGLAILFQSFEGTLLSIRIATVYYEKNTCVDQITRTYTVFLKRGASNNATALWSTDVLDVVGDVFSPEIAKRNAQALVDKISFSGELTSEQAANQIFCEFEKNAILDATGASTLEKKPFILVDGALSRLQLQNKQTDLENECLLVGCVKQTEKYGAALASFQNQLADQTSDYLSLDASHFCVKLHPQAKSVFIVELNQLLSKEETEQIVQQLQYYSTDAIFLGYPYPLLFADQLARISLKEKDTLLYACLAEHEVAASFFEKNCDVHKELDSLQY